MPSAQPQPPPQSARRWPSASSISLGQPQITRLPSVQPRQGHSASRLRSNRAHSRPTCPPPQHVQKSILSRNLKSRPGKARTASVLPRASNSVRYLLHPGGRSGSQGSRRLEYIASKVTPLRHQARVRPKATASALPPAASKSLDAVRAQLAKSQGNDTSGCVSARPRTSVAQSHPPTSAAPPRLSSSTIQPSSSTAQPQTSGTSSHRPWNPLSGHNGSTAPQLVLSGPRPRAAPDLLSNDEEERAAATAIASGKEPVSGISIGPPPSC